MHSLIIQVEKENCQLQQEAAELQKENSKLKEKDRLSDEKITKLQRIQSPEIEISKKKEADRNGFRILKEEEIENLEKIEDIGSGGGGKVMKVAMKKFYALKQMILTNSNFNNLQNFIQEYEIMNMPDHPNVVDAIGIFMSNKNISPNNLQKAIENRLLTREEVVEIIYQIAEGMKYIHSKKIIHRDLKPTNILIASDGTVKICDFGISKLMTIEEQTMTRGVGSQKFMAPEVINEENFYDEKVDVYSFGVVVIFILGGDLRNFKVGDIFKGKKAEIHSLI